MEQKVERKPLLSDPRIAEMCPHGRNSSNNDIDWADGASAARDFYEGMIDRGELVIPETTHCVEAFYKGTACYRCARCRHICDPVENAYCGGCGRKVSGRF